MKCDLLHEADDDGDPWAFVNWIDEAGEPQSWALGFITNDFLALPGFADQWDALIRDGLRRWFISQGWTVDITDEVNLEDPNQETE